MQSQRRWISRRIERLEPHSPPAQAGCHIGDAVQREVERGRIERLLQLHPNRADENTTVSAGAWARLGRSVIGFTLVLRRG